MSARRTQKPITKAFAMGKKYSPPKRARESETAEEIRARFSYDPETGHFTRNGLPCARIDKNFGYALIHYRGYSYKAHRLAWLYVHGEWPKAFLDHINHDRADNRIANLRESTRAQNVVNRRGYSKHGVKGVSYQPRNTNRPWTAYCRAEGKKKYLGCFATKEEASAAYLEAAKKVHGDFATAEIIVQRIAKPKPANPRKLGNGSAKAIGEMCPTPEEAKAIAEAHAGKVAA